MNEVSSQPQIATRPTDALPYWLEISTYATLRETGDILQETGYALEPLPPVEDMAPYNSVDEAMELTNELLCATGRLLIEAADVNDDPDNEAWTAAGLLLHDASTKAVESQVQYETGTVPLLNKFRGLSADIVRLGTDLELSGVSITDYAESRMIGRAAGPFVVFRERMEERYAGNQSRDVKVQETLLYEPKAKIGIQFIENNFHPYSHGVSASDLPAFRLLYPDGTATKVIAKSRYQSKEQSSTYDTVAEAVGIDAVIAMWWPGARVSPMMNAD